MKKIYVIYKLNRGEDGELDLSDEDNRMCFVKKSDALQMILKMFENGEDFAYSVELADKDLWLQIKQDNEFDLEIE